MKCYKRSRQETVGVWKRGLVTVETSRQAEDEMELGTKEVYWRGPPVNRIGQGKASAHHADLPL